MSSVISFLFAVLISCACPAASAEPPFALAAPEAVGMSTERLARVEEFVERMRRENKLAGAVTLIARNGKLVWLKAHGFADLESKRAMRVDDLFAVQSMTKPIATVAALQLIERGLLQLGDPVSKFLPEFSDMKVAVERADAPRGFDLVPASRPITILDLMTQRAGFTGVPPRESPAVMLRREADRSLPPNEDFTLEQFVRHLAASPLDMQPGAAFRYGPSMIVLGRVIEVITGKTLDTALRDQVFLPLGMSNTFFAVPEAQRARVALPYATRPGQGMVRIALGAMNPRFLSANGNLFSTATDYLRFCQMLLNGGELDGTRLLRKETVAEMTKNQLPEEAMKAKNGGKADVGHGFGLGFGVCVGKADPSRASIVGEYYWGGAASTHFWIAPKQELIVVALEQFMPYRSKLLMAIKPLIYQAVKE
jgi:CubicO group peptidase (beta-lactamase class C family)